MKKVFAVALALGLALATPGPASAKPGTAEIVITGGRLAQPFEVTDPNVLKHFSVWHGYLSGRGLTTAPSVDSKPYEVRFHVKFSDTDIRMA
ncbi:MAG: hypothetical protein ACRD4U_10490, partial [Candidatus Acidiferrales bacterium]